MQSFKKFKVSIVNTRTNKQGAFGGFRGALGAFYMKITTLNVILGKFKKAKITKIAQLSDGSLLFRIMKKKNCENPKKKFCYIEI